MEDLRTAQRRAADPSRYCYCPNWEKVAEFTAPPEHNLAEINELRKEAKAEGIEVKPSQDQATLEKKVRKARKKA